MIHVKLFGQLAEVTGTNTLHLPANSTNELLEKIHRQFPALKNHEFAIAVEKKMVHENIMLQDGFTVALLPAFSGG